MLQAHGARRVSVGLWCWDPIGPSRELKTQALNRLPNRGTSRLWLAVDCGPPMDPSVTKIVTSGSNSAPIDLGRDAVNHSFC